MIFVIAYNGFDYDTERFVDEIIPDYGFFNAKKDAERFAKRLNIGADELTRLRNSENECCGYYVCQLNKQAGQKGVNNAGRK